MTMAAAAAAATCRGWGQAEGLPGGVSPSPPRHFTFEPLVGPSDPPRPRRRHRRVLYPPAVRRLPPTEEPSAAKRLLVLLLAVVSAQVYSAPGEVTPETPSLPAVTSPPGDEVLLRTAVTATGTTWTPNGTLVGTPAAPGGTLVGAFCPRPLLSPALRPHNCTAR
ncbi:radiation-inducible immediate-early gene IEX-1 [Tyto alba]|uniref:radiation-inducible immediate-early gene IEX-1 n=1 Tax=Tyto alba TaxID=56313 RepID=UPI001C663ECD|nr:radiation-inducible immediate-early gene IEX-1 [Tyto alba]